MGTMDGFGTIPSLYSANHNFNVALELIPCAMYALSMAMIIMANGNYQIHGSAHSCLDPKRKCVMCAVVSSAWNTGG
jgi:hypothetical protein